MSMGNHRDVVLLTVKVVPSDYLDLIFSPVVLQNSPSLHVVLDNDLRPLRRIIDANPSVTKSWTLRQGLVVSSRIRGLSV
jgi:hypothetical protein